MSDIVHGFSITIRSLLASIPTRTILGHFPFELHTYTSARLPLICTPEDTRTTVLHIILFALRLKQVILAGA